MYRAHGGKIGTPQPPVIAFNDDTDSATATTMLHEKIMKSSEQFSLRWSQDAN